MSSAPSSTSTPLRSAISRRSRRASGTPRVWMPTSATAREVGVPLDHLVGDAGEDPGDGLGVEQRRRRRPAGGLHGHLAPFRPRWTGLKGRAAGYSPRVTDLIDRAHHPPPASPTEPHRRSRHRAELGLVLGLVLVSAAVRFIAAQGVAVPWIAPDESIYALQGRSLLARRHARRAGRRDPVLLGPLSRLRRPAAEPRRSRGRRDAAPGGAGARHVADRRDRVRLDAAARGSRVVARRRGAVGGDPRARVLGDRHDRGGRLPARHARPLDARRRDHAPDARPPVAVRGRHPRRRLDEVADARSAPDRGRRDPARGGDGPRPRPSPCMHALARRDLGRGPLRPVAPRHGPLAARRVHGDARDPLRRRRHRPRRHVARGRRGAARRRDPARRSRRARRAGVPRERAGPARAGGSGGHDRLRPAAGPAGGRVRVELRRPSRRARPVDRGAAALRRLRHLARTRHPAPGGRDEGCGALGGARSRSHCRSRS